MVMQWAQFQIWIWFGDHFWLVWLTCICRIFRGIIASIVCVWSILFFCLGRAQRKSSGLSKLLQIEGLKALSNLFWLLSLFFPEILIESSSIIKYLLDIKRLLTISWTNQISESNHNYDCYGYKINTVVNVEFAFLCKLNETLIPQNSKTCFWGMSMICIG